MIETHTVASEFYADEALDLAEVDGKSFGEMRQWAERNVPDLQLRSYFLSRAIVVLRI